MIAELRQAFDLAEQQPEAVQRYIADVVKRELEEREWDTIVDSPHGQETLERLAAEARVEIARGDVEDGGWE